MSMRVVWKYLLQDIDITHEMPYKAQPRAVGIDPATGEIALWCEVDPGQPTARHQFHVRGTGHPLGEVAGRPYIGTHRPPRPVRAPRLRWRRDRPTPGGHGTVKHRHTTQQCGLDCGRDIGNTAYVCVDCADQLRDLLTALPDQESDRARVLTYPHLPFDADTNPYRETGDAPIRHGLAADLDEAIARPTVVRPDAVDAAYTQTAATTPLPFGYTPSEAKWVLRDTLRRWGDDIARRRGLFRPFDTLTALGPWLATQVGWIRQQPDGPQAIEEMTAALRQALRVIDRPADRKYAGPCTATITDVDRLALDCDGELYAHPGARTIPCPQCGAEYDVADRRAWLLEQAEDRLLPATELARAVDGLGVPITGAMIRGWVHRGRLTARGLPGFPVYRVGDVLELVRSRYTGAATVPA